MSGLSLSDPPTRTRHDCHPPNNLIRNYNYKKPTILGLTSNAYCLQMSERFNQEVSLSGKIPSGFFNLMFGYKGCWQKDASTTKTLAFDGCFITLYNIELQRSQITLSEKVKMDVPPSWDPAALAQYDTFLLINLH